MYSSIQCPHDPAECGARTGFSSRDPSNGGRGMTTNVLVTFYSTYGHVHQMPLTGAEGAEKVPDSTVRLRRIAELEEARKALSAQDAYVRAQQAQADIPVVTHDDLRWADGIAWGTPTRYGNMSAQMKQFASIPIRASERSRKSLPFTLVLTPFGNLSGEDCDEQGEDNHRRRTGARVARRDVRRRRTAAAGATGGATTAASAEHDVFCDQCGARQGRRSQRP